MLLGFRVPEAIPPVRPRFRLQRQNEAEPSPELVAAKLWGSAPGSPRISKLAPHIYRLGQTVSRESHKLEEPSATLGAGTLQP